MIEVTTTALMLFSAFYGSPQAVENSTVANVKEETASTTVIENYTRAFFKDTPILAEIAKCESKFSQFDKNGKVVRGKQNRYDVGLLQINEFYHLDDSKKAGYDIYTIDGNLGYGKLIYDKYGTAPWSASQKCWGKYANKDLARK